MQDEKFKLVSPYSPTGDQPEAIDKLSAGVEAGLDKQALLGVTGSGKTFTMANIIPTSISLPLFWRTIRPLRLSYANALCTYKTIFGDSIENASDESYDMYPVDGDTALCDRDRLLVKLDSKKALTIRKTVEKL